MHYSLWHLDTGNLIGDFDGRNAAMEAVREEVETNDDLDRLMLEGDDPSEPVLYGADLGEAALGEHAKVHDHWEMNL